MQRASGLAVAVACGVLAANIGTENPHAPHTTTSAQPSAPAELFEYADAVDTRTGARWRKDVEAVREHRTPGEWQQDLLTIPNGYAVFGSKTSGETVAVLPAREDGETQRRWVREDLEGALASIEPYEHGWLDRERVERAFQLVTRDDMGYSWTRGSLLHPNLERYGQFLDTFTEIYEQFGLPGELIAQCGIESAFDPRAWSGKSAVGLCQWLHTNWQAMQRRADYPMETYDVFSQVEHSAAMMWLLSVQHDSHLYALTEYQAGPTNVQRMRAVAQHAGITGPPQHSYFQVFDVIKSLRESEEDNSDIHATIGNQTMSYATLILANAPTVREAKDTIPQTRVERIRVRHTWERDELVAATGLALDSLQTFNPHLINRIEEGHFLYLPADHAMSNWMTGSVETYWHRDRSEELTALMARFDAEMAGSGPWTQHHLERLSAYRSAFSTLSGRGARVLGNVLGQVIEDVATSGRSRVMASYLSNEDQRERLVRGAQEVLFD